jgi:hypothetical protein
MKRDEGLLAPREMAVAMAVIATTFFVVYFGGMIYAYFGNYHHPDSAIAYPIHADP